jgi:putative spermidine/putrescine transport system ATP-binding protein
MTAGPSGAGISAAVAGAPSDRATPGGVPAVRAIGLRKTYGEVVALERLDLDVGPGEFFTLLGPSGSGKTTTLRLIGGFERPDSGAVELGGRDVTRDPPYQREVNTVFQDYALFPHMSVAENVAYGLMVRKLGKRERLKAAQAALEMVRLPDVGARRPIALSGGQRQRVALARALVNRPKVLLLDEPLGALDLKLRQEMQLELQRIQRDLDEPVTFLYVTHDQEEALTMSDRIAVFSAGRIEQVGTPGDVYERPANEFVADFVGTSNVIERDGRRVTVRPEKIRMLDIDDPGPGGGMETATGTVREVVYLGPVTRYIVALDEGRTLVALRQNLDVSAGQALAERGRRVRLVWHPDHAFAVQPAEADASLSEQEEDTET